MKASVLAKHKYTTDASIWNQTTFHGFLPSTIGHTAGLASVQISASAHPPPFPATLIGFSEVADSFELAIVEAGGQTVVVEKKISQTGDVLETAAVSRPTTMSSITVMSFSSLPAVNVGNKKKKPISRNGISDNTELMEGRSEEFGESNTRSAAYPSLADPRSWPCRWR